MFELTDKGEQLKEIIRKQRTKEPLLPEETDLLDQLRLYMFGYMTDDYVEEANRITKALLDVSYRMSENKLGG